MGNLALDLGLGGAASGALGLGTLQVASRDPALVEFGTAGYSRAVGTHNSSLISRVDLLGATRGFLSTLTALATATLLGEEGGEPGVVDEVDGSGECAQENEVKEDAD
jgi:hypothetical protein